MNKQGGQTSLDGVTGLTVPQLDALALKVRTRAAKYCAAIDLVKELVVAMEGEHAMTNENNGTKQEAQGGRRRRTVSAMAHRPDGDDHESTER